MQHMNFDMDMGGIDLNNPYVEDGFMPPEAAIQDTGAVLDLKLLLTTWKKNMNLEQLM